jgi:hypothetical protein
VYALSYHRPVIVHLRKRSASRHALLALILLFVQTGAILHGYSHQDSARRDATASTEQCLYCKAAAPLLGTAGAPTVLALLLFVALPLLLQTLAAPLAPAFRHPAFRSRAPPQLL